MTLFRDPSNGRMHKGPSFQRAGARSYKDIGEWTPVQSFREEQKGGMYVHHREGYFADYPEVKIEVEYRFFADAPYFIVADSMTVEKPMQRRSGAEQRNDDESVFHAPRLARTATARCGSLTPR